MYRSQAFSLINVHRLNTAMEGASSLRNGTFPAPRKVPFCSLPITIRPIQRTNRIRLCIIFCVWLWINIWDSFLVCTQLSIAHAYCFITSRNHSLGIVRNMWEEESDKVLHLLSWSGKKEGVTWLLKRRIASFIKYSFLEKGPVTVNRVTWIISFCPHNNPINYVDNDNATAHFRD